MRFLGSFFLLVILLGGSWFYLQGAPLPWDPRADAEAGPIARDRPEALGRAETSASADAAPIAEAAGIVDAAGVTGIIEAAEAGAAKLERLQLDMEEVWFSGEELTALFAERTDLWEIGMATPPVVSIEGNALTVSASVDPDLLPEIRGLEEIRRVLPRAAEVAVTGTIEALTGADALVEITGVRIAGFSIPSAILPTVLGLLDLPASPGVPEGSFRLPLPRGANHVRVAEDHLILAP